MVDIREEVKKLASEIHNTGYPVDFTYKGFRVTSILAHIYTVRTETTNVEIGKFGLDGLVAFLEDALN